VGTPDSWKDSHQRIAAFDPLEGGLRKMLLDRSYDWNGIMFKVPKASNDVSESCARQ
jgi:hypothetical protein